MRGISSEESGVRARLDSFFAGFGGIASASLMGMGVWHPNKS